MDNQKDKSSVPDKVFEVNDTSLSPVFFGKNRHFAFVYRKVERLAAAVHIVTSFVREDEPVRARIRIKSLELLDHVSLLRTEKLIQSLLELIAVLDVAYMGGFISEMNFSLLKSECVELAKFIKAKEHNISSGKSDLSDEFFADSYEVGMEHVRRAVPASGIDSIKDSLVKDTRSKKKVGNKRSGSRRTQRREVILALLKHKSPITVKDVGETIVDCSEKTLQRELVALVQEGVLKKEGERRWSNYFLL
jgi:hypothetical protein|tara:strand:- start:23280 stop:24026 length:747 start_codon:yes stop_codon:yes gene_type:complete